MKMMTSKANPVTLGLSEAENDFLSLLTTRQTKGTMTTTGDIVKKKGKSRSYVSAVLSSLCKKKLVERYNHKYYRLAPTETAKPKKRK
jgi:predicted transcriptional regulator